MTYSNGTIYKIICSIDDKICYIGSTFNKLTQRWTQHKDQYKQFLKENKKGEFSIYEYFTKYGIDKFKIIKIKNYLCYREHNKDLKHLKAYETLWINKTKTCINKILPFNPLFKFCQKLYHKNYRQNNKDKIKLNKLKYKTIPEYILKKKETDKKYRDKNKDKLKLYKIKYNMKNKNILKEKSKKNYQNNK